MKFQGTWLNSESAESTQKNSRITIISVIIIIVTEEFFSILNSADSVQTNIFISSRQNCVSITLTCKNYHDT